MKTETVKNLSIVVAVLLLGMAVMWVMLEAPRDLRLLVGGAVGGAAITIGFALWMADRTKSGGGGGDSTG